MNKMNFISMKFINIMLLVTHVMLCILFVFLGVKELVILNIGSIITYLILFSICKKHIVLYTLIACLEVLVTIIASSLIIGWDTGFHMYFFCLIASVFITDYVNISDGKKTFYPAIISVVIAIIYIVLRGITGMPEFSKPDVLTGREAYIFCSFNIIITFIFLIYYFNLLMKKIIAKENTLKDIAHKDELTGLSNRYLMCDWLRQAFEDASKLNTEISMAMIDIDDFKTFNDRFGHRFGDFVLREFSKRMENVMGDRVKKCRWGGEEFVFLCCGNGSYEYLCSRLDMLKNEANEKTYKFNEVEEKVTFSSGISKYKNTDSSYHDLLGRADKLLYKSKLAGKNRNTCEE